MKELNHKIDHWLLRYTLEKTQTMTFSAELAWKCLLQFGPLHNFIPHTIWGKHNTEEKVPQSHVDFQFWSKQNNSCWVVVLCFCPPPYIVVLWLWLPFWLLPSQKLSQDIYQQEGTEIQGVHTCVQGNKQNFIFPVVRKVPRWSCSVHLGFIYIKKRTTEYWCKNCARFSFSPFANLFREACCVVDSVWVSPQIPGIVSDLSM